MKLTVLLLTALVVICTIECAPQEERRPNPDLVVLQNFVRELREASRGPRHASSSSEESDERRYYRRQERREQRRQKYFPLIVASTTTTTPATDYVLNPEAVHEHEREATTEKHILRYSPPPHKSQPIPIASTVYPPYSTTYRYVPKQPYDLQNVNDGVGTILRGVGSARLSEILRGSFMFTRNGRVRDVANNVIDSIFGPRDPHFDKPPTSENGGLFPLTGF